MKLVKVTICAIIVSFIFTVASSVHAAGLLTGLEIEGIGALDVSSKRSWTLGLTTPYDYANITATAAEGVTVEGAGKVSIKEGANTITITASSGGQSETYTINLNVTKKSGGAGAVVDPKDGTVSYDKDATDIKNPETGAFMNYTLLIGTCIISIAVITKFAKKKIFYNI